MRKVRFILWNILEVPVYLEGEEEGELGIFFFLITSQIIPPPFSLSNHVNDQGNENKALDSQLTLSSCYIRSRRSSLTGGRFLQGKQIYKLAFCLLLLLISLLFCQKQSF